MNLNDILGQHCYINVNKNLALKVGIEAAILISCLIDKKQESNWFFCDYEIIEKETTLKTENIKKAIKSLQDANILDFTITGVPQHPYLRINETKILSILIGKLENETFEVKPENNRKQKYISDYTFEDKQAIHSEHGRRLFDLTNNESVAQLEAINVSIRRKVLITEPKLFRMSLVTSLKFHEKYEDWLPHFRNWLMAMKPVNEKNNSGNIMPYNKKL